MGRGRARQRLIDNGGSDVGEATATTEDTNQGHVNFFQQLEDGEGVHKTNKQHEDEKKKEQEEYEKKVGYLTYLGQDTEELTGEQVWWKKRPQDRIAMSEKDKLKTAVHEKQKDFLDPLSDLRKYLKCDGIRLTMKKYVDKLERKEAEAIDYIPVSKKRCRSSSSSSSSRSRSRKRKKIKKDKRKKSSSSSKRYRSRSVSSSRSRSKFKGRKRKHKKEKVKKSKDRYISSERGKKNSKRKQKLKKKKDSSESESDHKSSRSHSSLERLRQERLERERIEREKANKLLFGEPVVENKTENSSSGGQNQKYNSQFNPDIARQNKLDPHKKYWLE